MTLNAPLQVASIYESLAVTRDFGLLFKVYFIQLAFSLAEEKKAENHRQDN